MKNIPSPFPIFDTNEKLSFEASLPKHLLSLKEYEKDYKGAHAFLYAYKSNKPTFNAYRREVERLLLWTWLIQKKSILDLTRLDMESYLSFCQKPPKSWIGTKKVPHFIVSVGESIANLDWHPFVKTESKNQEGSRITPYSLSDKSFKDIFAVLSSFYNFLIHEDYTQLNPILQIRQKSKYFKKYQGPPKIRRLTELQWDYVVETAGRMAKNNSAHERTFFIMIALYAMYLRISELVSSPRWTPKMCDFHKDHEDNWWFTTVGKGNKERQIAVSDAMLEALKKWRIHLGLSPLPAPSDRSPLIPKERGIGPITSTNQIRNLVQKCFDQAIFQMKEEGFKEEAENLQSATVHWLRHTGISDDVKRRPREHVRDDAGHSSSATTDRYIDIELRARHASAKEKPINKC